MSSVFWWVLQALLSSACAVLVLGVLVPVFVMLVAKAWAYGTLAGQHVYFESSKKKEVNDERS